MIGLLKVIELWGMIPTLMVLGFLNFWTPQGPFSYGTHPRLWQMLLWKNSAFENINTPRYGIFSCVHVSLLVPGANNYASSRTLFFTSHLVSYPLSGLQKPMSLTIGNCPPAGYPWSRCNTPPLLQVHQNMRSTLATPNMDLHLVQQQIWSLT